MTAIIIPFPTLEERDAVEFDRFGTSSYTRAIDEARALLHEAWALKDRSPLRGRVDALTSLVARLAIGRPEMVEEFVELGRNMRFELRAIPPLLAAMLAATLHSSPSMQASKSSAPRQAASDKAPIEVPNNMTKIARTLIAAQI